MDRKEFFKAIGVSSAGILMAGCLNSCKKEYQQIIPPDVNFTLDLSTPENAPLRFNGGYIYKSGIIIARTSSGQIIAVAQACTHVGTTVEFQSNNNQFYCPNHGATFTNTGSIIQGPVNMPLKQYAVTENGTVVTVIG